MLVSSHMFFSAASWTPPAGMTEAFDIANVSPPVGLTIEGNYVLQAAAGASGVKTATANSGAADEGATHILALRRGNAAPTVSLTSPANGAVFAAPANITLTATAADSDGTITKVEFFQGTTLLAALTTAPYTFALNNVAAGVYTFTATATDNQNGTTTSAPVNITVNAAVAQLYFIHTDHLNTPRVITNQAQQVVWRWDNQDPFGGNVPDENPSGLGTFTCNLRLPGQYFDKETGLSQNWMRDYDPGIGRYVESDPIGMLGGINSYAYVDGNPISLTDPLGLFDLPSIPQPALDFVTGISDAASLGLGPIVRNALDVSGGVDVCSGSYTVGQYASLFLGAGRLAYAGAAKALPLLVSQGTTSLDTALAVSAARNTLKQAACLGTFPNYRTYTAQQVLAKYGADPAAITAAATRTNPAVNAVGANLAIGAAVGRATCGCQ